MTTEELYRQFETLTVDMVVKEKHDILECAAMMMAQAMRIYGECFKLSGIGRAHV